MASLVNALVCAALAVGLWTLIGLSLSQHLMTRSLVWPAAPTLGWAVHTAAVFPIFCLFGMTKNVVIVVIVCSMLAAGWTVVQSRSNRAMCVDIPLWTIAAAACLATAIMMLILPEVAADGVRLTDVIFDHSKVAMIDDMARLGVPAGNPFFGESDGLDRLSYYYLWHFSAAELSVLTGLSGWETDAGMTCFTAFSSLLLMMGLARFLSGRRSSAAWVLVLGTALSIRPILRLIFGQEIVDAVTGWSTGFGTWLFQISWAPQHVASAACVLLATILMAGLSQRQTLLASGVLALVVTAGFESSTWVGGITFLIAASAVGLLLFWRTSAETRVRFIVAMVAAALFAVALSSLFIFDQFRASAIRSTGLPIGLRPYEVLGEETPDSIRRFLDVPAYWSIYLFTELAAFYPAGFVMMVLMRKDPWLSRPRKGLVAPLGLLAFVSLAVGSLFVSRIGDNNDLGWRSVLPAILVLISFTGAGLSRYLHRMPTAYAVAVLGLVGLASFEGIRNLGKDIVARTAEPSQTFEYSSRMWDDVRKNSSEGERIANNPRFLAGMTRWLINPSWALLSNRRSCYAGSSFGPFAPRTRDPRERIDAQFDRVFSGNPEANDVDELASLYNCSVIVLTSEDGAWIRDPFRSGSLYRLVHEQPDKWRIYRRSTSSTK